MDGESTSRVPPLVAILLSLVRTNLPWPFRLESYQIHFHAQPHYGPNLLQPAALLDEDLAVVSTYPVPSAPSSCYPQSCRSVSL